MGIRFLNLNVTERIVSRYNWKKLFDLACNDVYLGVTNWRVWYMLGLHEIRQRYRRSSLGALWVTLNLAIQVSIMTFLLGGLFQQPSHRYMPYISLSLALWGFISSSICESTAAIYGNATTIMQIKRPLMTYIMHTVWRNVIILGHNLGVFLIVGPLFGFYPTFEWLLLIPAFLLNAVVVTWMSLVVAIVSTRFRDVPLIVSNIFSVLIWLTPVMYLPSQLSGNREILLWISPFSHMMQIMRGPLMDEDFSSLSWLVTAGVAVVGWLATLALYTRTRHRLTYWL